jgi:hypothetical protein
LRDCLQKALRCGNTHRSKTSQTAPAKPISNEVRNACPPQALALPLIYRISARPVGSSPIEDYTTSRALERAGDFRTLRYEQMVGSAMPWNWHRDPVSHCEQSRNQRQAVEHGVLLDDCTPRSPLLVIAGRASRGTANVHQSFRS